MSDQDLSTPSRDNNQINMSEEMIRRFEQLFEDVLDRLDRQDTELANLCRGVPNVQRRDRRELRMEVYEKYEYRNDVDEDAVIEADMGKMRNREVELERKGRNLVGDEVDGNMGNIKMSIPPFKEMSDPKTYLE